MEEVAILLGLAFAANKLVSTIKALTSGQWNAAVTQLTVWVVAFAAISLAASAEVTEALTLPGMTESLGSMDFASLVLLGLITGSTGSVVFDFKKAIDGSDSAVESSLL